MGVSASSNPFSCDPAIVQAVGTYLISRGTITYADYFINLSVGFSCKIDNVLYSNAEVVSKPISPTLPGLRRVDFVVMNTESTFDIVQGPVYTDVVVEPLVPEGTVFVTAINVFGDTVNVQEPIPGSQFVEKQEFAENTIEDSGDIAITLDTESTAFRLTGAVTSVTGFEMTSDFISTNNYIGKEIKLVNNTGADIPIAHNGAATYPVRFPSEVAFVWKDKEVIFFKPVKTDALHLEFCGVGRDAFAASGVTILNTDILSSALTTKDVDGFVAYINALGSSFAVASNQIQYYTVTDIGMKFMFKLNGRSFGGSEPDITTSDVIQFGLDYFDNHFFKDYQVQSRGDATLTVIGAAPLVVTGTAGVITGGTGLYALTQPHTGVTSATTTAGSSCGYREGSFQPFNFTLGFKVNFKFANSDAATVADARCFVGCTSTNAQIGNVNPSTLLSMFGIGSDNAEANLSIMHNDGSGTATKIPLGANFPANTSKVDIYSVTWWVFPGTTTLYYEVKRENTGHTASGKITTDINTALQYVPHFFRNNGATALAVNQTFFSIIAKLPF